MTETTVKKLSKIDEAVSQKLRSLDRLINNMDFEEVGEFEITESVDKSLFVDIPKMGIYFFEIRIPIEVRNSKNWSEWSSEFATTWDNTKRDNGTKYKSPKTYAKRINSHKELKEWVPLYIGKSKEMWNDSKGRIDEHFNHSPAASTYSLKLCARNYLQNKTIRLSVIPFNVTSYDAIAPRIESKKRDELNPIIGKQ